MSDQENQAGEPDSRPENRGAWSKPAVAIAASAVLLAIGAAAGAGTGLMIRQGATQALLPPTAIASLGDDTQAAIKGSVVEIFGNKFVLQDQSGRALVETGPEGEGGTLVAKDETVTVQGRFDDGFLHGEAIIHADGKTDMLGPPGPRPHGPRDWLRRLGA